MMGWGLWLKMRNDKDSLKKLKGDKTQFGKKIFSYESTKMDMDTLINGDSFTHYF